MVRKIIRIDEARCNGCGACAAACHEGAIRIIGGKAKLTREDYCDGLGDCLPACPAGAISFEKREAPAYDEAAVRAARQEGGGEAFPCVCPGSDAKSLRCLEPAHADGEGAPPGSCLKQWPVQIKLVPIRAEYFDGASLLIAADCTAYAYGDFHSRFMKNRITLVGCPKLDEGDYADKLTQIFAGNDIKSVTVVRMEVPCCGGLESAVKRALGAGGRPIPCQTVTISTEGRILG